MADMRLIVAGAGGRMGRTLTRVIAETPGRSWPARWKRRARNCWARMPACSPACPPTASSCRPICGRCRRTPTPFSISPCRPRPSPMSRSPPNAAWFTSSARPGCRRPTMAVIKSVTSRAVVVQSGNMSLGVNLLAALAKRVAQSLDEEFRHRNPGDAPQGQDRCAVGHRVPARRSRRRRPRHRPRSPLGAGPRRHTGARRPGDIGFASLRGGTVTGDHSVIFAGPMERIELTHRAEDRTMFAQGAVKAALWARGKQPGFYTMTDVLGLPTSERQSKSKTEFWE